MNDDLPIDVIAGIRLRPAMYCADTGVQGLHSVVFEAIELACEEIVNGNASWINVTIHKDDSIEVEYDGRSVSVAPIPEFQGRSRFEIAFTVLEGDGRFFAKEPIQISRAPGLECLVLNSLSEWLVAEMDDGQSGIWQIQFRAGRVSVPLHRASDSRQRSIRIHFRPDRSIFRTTEVEFVLLRSRCLELAAFDSRLRFHLEDRRTRDVSVACPNGVADLVARLNRFSEPAYPRIIAASAKSGSLQVQLAFQHVVSGPAVLLSYCNGLLTREGGTHMNGFRCGVTRAMNHGQTEKADRLKADQILNGMTLVLCVWVPDAQFEGPTRNRLANHELERMVELLVFQNLRDQFETDPTIVARIHELARRECRHYHTEPESIGDTVLFRA